MTRCNAQSRVPGCVLALLAALWLTGCSAEHYKMSADRDVYSIISQKSPQVPGMDPSFSLEVPAAAAAPTGEDPLTLSLADAVAVAAAQSRDFQERREDVYIEALDLTYQRYLWGPRFTGALSGMWERSDGESSLSSGVGFGVSQALATGADIGLSLSSAFLMYLSGDPRKSAASLIELSITQPLWRGAGKRVAQENLTQAERDMVYELRSFVRFRRELFVSIASDYYRVLQQKDTVENRTLNLQNLEESLKRAQEWAKAGRLPEYQVDQARQDVLSAQDRWVRAVQEYESLLDEFKITLGFPPEMSLDLDPAELIRLRDAGPQGTTYTRGAATERALKLRLDLASSLDSVADAERKLEVARNGLGPDLDFVASAALQTEGDTKPLKFTTKGGAYSAGLELDLPLDRLQERNAYREAFITLDRTRRAYELLRDRVKEQVFSAWRRLDEAMQSYEIQQTSVELATRRVEITSILLDGGRAETRDMLEAQAALLDARNALTRALVDYRIAVLQLYRDMGTLTFKDEQFTEVNPDDEPAASP